MVDIQVMKQCYFKNRLRAVAWSTFLLAGFVAVSGCDRPGGPQRAQAESERAAEDGARSPVDAARDLHAAHAARDYAQIGSLIVPERQAETVQMLRATDRLIDAHQAMQSAAAERFGKRVHRAFNLGEVENNLGVFSKDIDVLAQHFKGDAATVTIQVASRVPLLRARFEKVDGRWCYVPPQASPASVAALDELTAEIEQVATSLKEGMTPLAYHNAIMQKLIPGMTRVAFGATVDETGIRVTDAHEADGEQ